MILFYNSEYSQSLESSSYIPEQEAPFGQLSPSLTPNNHKGNVIQKLKNILYISYFTVHLSLLSSYEHRPQC